MFATASSQLRSLQQQHACPSSSAQQQHCRSAWLKEATDRRCRRRCRHSAAAASAGFHQAQLAASDRAAGAPPPPLLQPSQLVLRGAESDGELQAVAWLRALSFGRYPEDRQFAAEVGSVVGGVDALHPAIT